MESTTTDNFAKSSQALADTAADKAQSGIRRAQDTVKGAGNALSSKIEDVRSEAGTAVNRGSKRVQSMGRQGIDAMTDMAGQVGDLASNASESIVAYTKKNPVLALGIAAASGALLYAAIRALTTSHD